MNSILTKIRNIFEAEASRFKLLDILADNWFYKKYIMFLFERKINNIIKNREYSFAIEVTSFCNASCNFCPNSFMKRHKNVMGMDVIKVLVKRIKEENIVPKQFNLTGTGEPLIDKDLFKKISLLKKNFPDTPIFFPTNLALANFDIQKKIVSCGLDNISVSLNADNAVDYKKIMKLDYDKTIENLNSLIKLRNSTKSSLKIYLKLAANPINKDNIKNFINIWKGKVDGIGISWIHTWAGAVKNGEKRKIVKRYPCRSLFEQIIIHSNGNIPLCCVDYEGLVVGGNILNDKILDAFNAPNIENIRKLHKNDQINKIKMCSNCRFSERGLNWLMP